MTLDYTLLQLKAATVFTPSAPVDKIALFAGRTEQLSNIVSAINTKGQHAVIFGERGVGKTSIANIIYDALQSIGLKHIFVYKVSCDHTDSFTSVWRKALRQINIQMEQPNFGLNPNMKQVIQNVAETLGQLDIVPDTIFQAFQKIPSPIVIIFDEFDRIGQEVVSTMFSDTMKCLSDNSIFGTLILVGVADDVNGLIKGHESISRSLIQIKIPRMSGKELRQILENGSRELGVEFTPDAIERILKHSQGLPHYAHLLGLEAVKIAAENQQLTITLKEVAGAIRTALQNAQQSIVSAYQRATRSAYKKHLYKEVLLACALAKTDDLGYFVPNDVREPLSRIMGKPYGIAGFFQHLHRFCSEGRGKVLERYGSRKGYLYRFRNPLLPPYVIIRGYMEGLIKDDSIDLISIWEKKSI